MKGILAQIAILAIWLVALQVVADSGIQLTRVGDKYSLVAHDAPLHEVLQRIDAIEEATLRFFGNQEGTINAVYRDVTLDQLLYRLGISYMLVYEPDTHGVYHLRDAVMGQTISQRFSDGKWDHVRQLIRDLAHDDVRWNAHNARSELLSMGCDIIPLLEEALLVSDYQGRHLAATILRQMRCPDYSPSDRLLEVTLQLLGRDQYDPDQYWSLFGPTGAFEYLHALEGEAYYRVRGRLVRNLSHPDRQKRFLSAALLAERGESEWAVALVRILAPHLADNDIPTDGGVAAHALYQLGPTVLPFLRPYRQSSDQQQAELADLVCSALEQGDIPRFAPVMYAGTPINPLRQRQVPGATRWRQERFPDASGRYHNLRETRRTIRDYFGQYYNPELADRPERAVVISRPTPPRFTDDDFRKRPAGVESITLQKNWKADAFPYTTRVGDTFETIARDFAVYLEDLHDANPGLQLNSEGVIAPGSTVLIPPMH